MKKTQNNKGIKPKKNKAVKPEKNKIKVLVIKGFASGDVVFNPGKEYEIDKERAENWKKAGLVK